MNKKKTTIKDDDLELINFEQIFSVVRANILFILITTIIFGFIGFVYAKKQPSIFLAEVKINFPTQEKFEIFSDQKFEKMLVSDAFLAVNSGENSKSLSISTYFAQIFDRELRSNRNLLNFFNKSKNYEEYKNYIEINNQLAKSVLQNSIKKLNEKKNEQIDYLYTFAFNENLNGEDFLNEYASYTFKKTFEKLKITIAQNLDNKIIKLETAVEYADTLDHKSIITNFPDKRFIFNLNPDVAYIEQYPFILGVKILNLKIKNAKFKKKYLDQFVLNFNPLLDPSYIKSKKKISVKKITTLGLLVGFFISLILVYIKTLTFREN